MITTSAFPDYQYASLEEAMLTFDVGTGGTIWIAENITLHRPIILRSDVILDFLGHTVYLARNTTFVIASGCQRAVVRNANVQVESGTPRPVILVRGAPHVPYLCAALDNYLDSHPDGLTSLCANHSTANNLFENITIEPEGSSDGLDQEPPHYDGIHLVNSQGAGVNNNAFVDIKMFGVDAAIHVLYLHPLGGSIQGNYFSKIVAEGFRTLIEFDYEILPDLNSIQQNLFSHVVGIPTGYSEAGMLRLAGLANHFDHVGILGSLDLGETDWMISSEAEDTWICAYSMLKLSDAGINTTVVAPLTHAKSCDCESGCAVLHPPAPVVKYSPHADVVG